MKNHGIKCLTRGDPWDQKNGDEVVNAYCPTGDTNAAHEHI